MFATLLGGIGLFLLGMVLLTDGLQSAAGGALRQMLARFTKGRLASIGTGVAFTAVVQSSSITTLATIGFVSAGLMTFSQSIGVIFGANLGTTVTSWLVSTVGLNVKLDAFALPIVGIGAIIRLFARGRLMHLGTVLAGFGLLFIGIETLQTAMGDVGERIDLERYIRPGVIGRLLLVLFGVVMTVVMQSSSAAVATTLTALHAGAIGLDDAAAVVIGQNVGTTAKAALGAIGASLPARRTAVAHIVFNFVTAAIAFVILPVFILGVDAVADRMMEPSDAVSLAAFHTAFNLLGVLLFLPFIDRFAALVERMVPDRPEPLLWRLADVRDAAPEIAHEAVRSVLVDIREAAVGHLESWLRREVTADQLAERSEEGRRALLEVRRFMGGLSLPETGGEGGVVGTFHALDHLARLHDALAEAPGMGAALSSHRLEKQRLLLAEALAETRALHVDAMALLAGRVVEERRRLREEMLRVAAAGGLAPDEADLRLSSSRWMDRVVYHLWRSLVRLAEAPAPEEESGVRAP